MSRPRPARTFGELIAAPTLFPPPALTPLTPPPLRALTLIPLDEFQMLPRPKIDVLCDPESRVESRLVECLLSDLSGVPDRRDTNALIPGLRLELTSKYDTSSSLSPETPETFGPPKRGERLTGSLTFACLSARTRGRRPLSALSRWRTNAASDLLRVVCRRVVSREETS